MMDLWSAVPNCYILLIFFLTWINQKSMIREFCHFAHEIVRKCLKISSPCCFCRGGFSVILKINAPEHLDISFGNRSCPRRNPPDDKNERLKIIHKMPKRKKCRKRDKNQPVFGIKKNSTGKIRMVEYG